MVRGQSGAADRTHPLIQESDSVQTRMEACIVTAVCHTLAASVIRTSVTPASRITLACVSSFNSDFRRIRWHGRETDTSHNCLLANAGVFGHLKRYDKLRT